MTRARNRDRSPAPQGAREQRVGPGPRAAPADLYITRELQRRVPRNVDYQTEKLALQDIAAQMLDRPEQVLPRLVERAMAMTDAASAGISALEEGDGGTERFRWRYLRGELARFEGATTPRDDSPCGVCLDRFEPTLTRRPERYYAWIADAGVRCPEVLLVPLYVAHGEPLGTLWIVADQEGFFDSGHARVMRELASFVGIALTMLQDKQRLQEAVKQQELIADEMSHRVKNLFSIVDAMIHVSKKATTSADEMAGILSGRLHALAAAHLLVQRRFSRELNRLLPPSTTLRELIEAILKPYQTNDAARVAATGPEIILGDRTASSIALVFHEFATNAAKYGALARDEGHVDVSWERADGRLALRWRESGGPVVAKRPSADGFGSRLARNAIMRQLAGTFDLDWRAEGLRADFSLPLERLAD